MSVYNILIIGAPNVGKKSFLSRHLTGELSSIYEKGTICLMYREKFFLLNIDTKRTPEKKYDGLIIMTDLHNESSYDMVLHGQDPEFSDMEKAIVANKCDVPKSLEVILWKPEEYPYHEISCKFGHSISSPLIYLIRKLSHDQDIVNPINLPSSILIRIFSYFPNLKYRSICKHFSSLLPLENHLERLGKYKGKYSSSVLIPVSPFIIIVLREIRKGDQEEFFIAINSLTFLTPSKNKLKVHKGNLSILGSLLGDKSTNK